MIRPASGDWIGRGSWLRRVFRQSEVRSAPMVAGDEGLETAMQDALIEHDHLVEALAAKMVPITRST